jgi:outer membrane protein assembly factor BamB
MRWHRVLPLALTLALLVAPFTGHATAVDPAWVALSASGYDCDGSLATADDAGVLMWTKVLSDTERLDPELVRLDESTGLVDWTYRYVGPAHGQDAFVDVQPSASGAAVFVTGTEAWGKQTFETAIAQATGAPLWFHTAAGPYDTKQRRSAPVELAVSPDGSAVLEAGSSPSSDGDWDAYVSAYDPSSGAPLWSVRIDRSKDQARSIALSPDGATAYLSVATSRHLDRSLLVALDVTDGSPSGKRSPTAARCRRSPCPRTVRPSTALTEASPRPIPPTDPHGGTRPVGRPSTARTSRSARAEMCSSPVPSDRATRTRSRCA